MKKYKIGNVKSIDELSSLGGSNFIGFISDASSVCQDQVAELAQYDDIDWKIKSILSARSNKIVGAYGIIVNNDSDDKLYNFVCPYNGANIMCNKEVLGLILSTVGIFNHADRLGIDGDIKQAKLSYKAYLKLKDFCCRYLNESDLSLYLAAID